LAFMARGVADSFNEGVEKALEDRAALAALRQTASDARAAKHELLGPSSSSSLEDGEGFEGDPSGVHGGAVRQAGGGSGALEEGVLAVEEGELTKVAGGFAVSGAEDGEFVSGKYVVPELRALLEQLKRTSVRWRVLDRLSVNPYDHEAAALLIGTPDEPSMPPSLNNLLNTIKRLAENGVYDPDRLSLVLLGGQGAVDDAAKGLEQVEENADGKDGSVGDGERLSGEGGAAGMHAGNFADKPWGGGGEE